jgi:imidazole glycerol-phosphate synthase subunit HisF
MFRARVIPCLLLHGEGLVKTVRFKQPTYIGDPINAVRIFNDREVDELAFLDITATRERREPPFDRVRDIAGECFMPVCYGGGIRSVEHAHRLFALGIEKVLINTAAEESPVLVTNTAAAFGSQSVMVGIDVGRDWRGRSRVYTRGGSRNTGRDPIDYAREMAGRGAGEIFLNAIDRDGTMAGFDLDLIREMSGAVTIPLIACGGAGSIADLTAAVAAGASAVAAGSLFVFAGPRRAVLINYPSAAELRAAVAPMEAG